MLVARFCAHLSVGTSRYKWDLLFTKKEENSYSLLHHGAIATDGLLYYYREGHSLAKHQHCLTFANLSFFSWWSSTSNSIVCQSRCSWCASPKEGRNLFFPSYMAADALSMGFSRYFCRLLLYKVRDRAPWLIQNPKKMLAVYQLEWLGYFSSITTWADRMSRFLKRPIHLDETVDRKKKLLLLCNWSVSAIHLGEEPISTSSIQQAWRERETIPKQDRNFSGCHLEPSKGNSSR